MPLCPRSGRNILLKSGEYWVIENREWVLLNNERRGGRSTVSRQLEVANLRIKQIEEDIKNSVTHVKQILEGI